MVDLYTYGDIENQTIELFFFFLRSELYKDMSSIKSFMQKRKIIKKCHVYTHTHTNIHIQQWSALHFVKLWGSTTCLSLLNLPGTGVTFY